MTIVRGNESAGASFSDDEVYRYLLWRCWDNERERIAWIMLNPSTADEAVLDPTLRRCLAYSKAWGFGQMDIVNLYALRSTDPNRLSSCSDPVGPVNDEEIVLSCVRSSRVMVAWGCHRMVKKRAFVVLDMLSRMNITPMALRVSSGGMPVHPLYQKANIVPEPYV